MTKAERKRLMKMMGRFGGLAAARNMTKAERIARARKARRAQLKKEGETR